MLHPKDRASSLPPSTFSLRPLLRGGRGSPLDCSHCTQDTQTGYWDGVNWMEGAGKSSSLSYMLLLT